MSQLAIPCYTLKELDERKELEAYAARVMAGECNAKAYKKAIKKVAKFIEKVKR